MANIFEVKLDLDKQTSMQVVRIRQGDHSGTTIKAYLFDHGTPYSVQNTFKAVNFVMRLPDGEHYYRKNIDTFGTGYVQVTIDEDEAASVAGRTCLAYFSIAVTNTEAYSTSAFTVIVEPDALADALPPDSYDDAIDQAIAQYIEDEGLALTMTVDANGFLQIALT